MNIRFPEILRSLREKRGISQKQLGEMMFVNHSTVARWENGTRLPDAAMITRLAKCLGADANSLFHIQPEKGVIYYDNKDLNSLDLPSLRRKIGTVMQDAGLFQGDIYSNIVITAPQLTLNDAWEAAEKAGIAEDIRAMPMGMNTLVSEGQGGISGGQRQRIMIARAIAPKPKLLIFDEATSALDNKTQKQVSEALDGMGCTRLVIAHRLSTIRHCDRILVLDGGRIIEDGNYDQLIEKGGFFAELVERQRLDTAG